MNPNDVAPMVMVVVMAAMAGLVLIFRGPVGKALARRLEAHQAVPGDVDTRLHELEARVTELEQERVELGERLDFAERILSQVKDAPRELPR